MRRSTVLAAFVVGCSSPAPPAAPTCPEHTVKIGDACVAALDDCDERSVPKVGGGCTPVGVIACAEGFVADGVGGCTAVLPDATCGSGTRALPGQTACTELVDCGTDPYGSPPGAKVWYVDSNGKGGDGSRTSPFVTLGDAYDAAADGDTIALAEGRYKCGAVKKAITLWGRCPQKTTIVGSAGPGVAAIVLSAKVTLARVAITGDGVGLGIDKAEGAVVQHVWIHDVKQDGVWTATSSASFDDLLIEKVSDTGLGAYGSKVTIDRVVVRDVKAASDKTRGSCLAIESDLPAKKRSSAVVRHGILERVLVRDIAPAANDKKFGNGVSSLLDPDLGEPAALIVRDSVVTNVCAAGIYVQTSSGKLERTTVTDTKPQVSDGAVGAALYGAQGGTFEVFDSAFERNHHVSLLFTGDAHIERSIVRDSTPDDNAHGGFGIGSIPVTTDHAPLLEIVDSVIAHTQGVAVAFFGATGLVRGSQIIDVAVGTDGFGDGILSRSWPIGVKYVSSSVRVENSLMSHVARAAAFTAGDSAMSIETSTLRCNGLDVTVSALVSDATRTGALGKVDDKGGNVCGCGAASVCVAQTTELQPIGLSL